MQQSAASVILLDKSKFWRTLDNTLNKRIEPNIKLDNVKSEFEKLFNEKLVCNLDKEKDEEKELNALLSLNINHNRKDVEVEMDVVQSIIMDSTPTVDGPPSSIKS